MTLSPAKPIMPITPQDALQRVIEHREIFHDEMLHLMRLIMRGDLSPVMTSALITGLRVKKETIGEITAKETLESFVDESAGRPDGRLMYRVVRPN